MKVFGAAEGAGAGVEVLLLLLPLAAPNRLGVGVEDDEVVELVTLVGLLVRKEKAGFGAAEAGSAALFPKAKVGFGASKDDVSFLSVDFPKVKAGGGCSVGALGLLKEKPPVKACVVSASLLAAAKRKVDGAEEVTASFFSSGLPKLNVGAAGSLAACEDPKVGTTCGALVAKLGSPNLPNTDPAVAAEMLPEPVSVYAVSLEDVLLLLFS